MKDELKILERQLQRERAARKDAEKRLKIKSRALDKSHLELKNVLQKMDELVIERTRNLSLALDKANQSNHAKSQFLANMSHEIRTPMNAVLGMSYLVLQTGLNSKQKKYISIVHGAAESLLQIINDILDFSKIEAGKILLDESEFELVDVLERLPKLLGMELLEKNVVLKIVVDDKVPSLLIGDSLRLSQVLINLGNNALKFTEQGVVLISVSVEEQWTNKLLLHFVVSDNGIGITAEQKARLFDEFSQADSSITRKYGGSGLGLAIAKNLVQLLGGDIWVESEVNRGSDFHFTICLRCAEQHFQKNVDSKNNLKLNNDNHAKSNELNQDQDEISFKNCCILVVDDNKINRMVARGFLENIGISVDTRSSGKEAIAAVQEKSYDAIIMDIQMPGMDGIDATREIRALGGRFSDLPIIAMTANAFPEDVERSLAAGMNDHLSKPVNPQKFSQALSRYIVSKP